MSLTRNSLYNIGGTLVPAIVSIAVVPFYLQIIGIDRYGALAIAWLLLGYFSQADFGIGRAITRAVAARRASAAREELAMIVWSGLAFVAAIGVIGSIAVYGLGYWFFTGPFKVAPSIRAELLDGLWLLAACNLVTTLSGVATGGLRGLERFALVASSNMLSMIAMQLLPLLVAHAFGPDLFNLIAASLVARMLGIALQLAGTWRHILRHSPFAISTKEVRDLTRFGKWIFLSSFISPMMLYADRFLIGSILGAAAVAAYTIPFQVVSRVQIIPFEIVNAMFPRLASESADVASGKSSQYSAFIGQLFAPLVIGLVCLAGPLLSLWLGADLDLRSVLVGQILVVGAWFNALANVPYSYLQARGNSRFTALLHLAELPIFSVALAGLGWTFGLAGVAAAFALRCALDCLILLAKAGIARRELAVRLSGPVALMVAALALASAATDWTILLSAALILAGASTAWLVWFMPQQVQDRLRRLPGLGRLPGIQRDSGA